MTQLNTYAKWHLSDSSPELMISKLDHLGLINISGEQGRSFIHGQVTTDITNLTETQWRWGAHCDPKGKMFASFRTFSLATDLMLLMTKEALSHSLPQFKKYAVFSKAELVDSSGDYQIFGIAGSQAQSWITSHFATVDTINHDITAIAGGVILKDGERFILILDNSSAASLLNTISNPLYPANAWQALEIAAGYPNFYASHVGKFVPQMCNLQALNGISFDKGCYMGQETVARMEYRGGNKRALYILEGKVVGETTGDVDENSQLELILADGSAKKVGTIVDVVQTGQQFIMTAVLPNDIKLNNQLKLAEDPQSQLTIKPLPYLLTDSE